MRGLAAVSIDADQARPSWCAGAGLPDSVRATLLESFATVYRCRIFLSDLGERRFPSYHPGSLRSFAFWIIATGG